MCSMNVEDLKQVYGALLSSPGMDDVVKIDLKINRRLVLLLSQIIERGVGAKGKDGFFGMVDISGAEEIQHLTDLAKDCLEKAGLTALNQKLISLQVK